MSNLTLTIDDDLLRRARVRAAQEGTSVNAVAREALQAYVGKDAAERALDEFIDAGRVSPYGSGAQQRTWSRADLYEERFDRYGR